MAGRFQRTRRGWNVLWHSPVDQESAACVAQHWRQAVMPRGSRAPGMTHRETNDARSREKCPATLRRLPSPRDSLSLTTRERISSTSSLLFEKTTFVVRPIFPHFFSFVRRSYRELSVPLEKFSRRFEHRLWGKFEIRPSKILDLRHSCPVKIFHWRFRALRHSDSSRSALTSENHSSFSLLL